MQALHLRGGVLTGLVEIALGRGLARSFGQAIARTLGIPLQPDRTRCGSKSAIGPTGCCGTAASTLAWTMASAGNSHFCPVRVRPDDLWPEQADLVRLGLAVELIKGAG